MATPVHLCPPVRVGVFEALEYSSVPPPGRLSTGTFCLASGRRGRAVVIQKY